jgi:hypothetical protein
VKQHDFRCCSGIPAPAPTIAVPESIWLRNAAKISFRSVGGAILMKLQWRGVVMDFVQFQNKDSYRLECRPEEWLEIRDSILTQLPCRCGARRSPPPEQHHGVFRDVKYTDKEENNNDIRNHQADTGFPPGAPYQHLCLVSKTQTRCFTS